MGKQGRPFSMHTPPVSRRGVRRFRMAVLLLLMSAGHRVPRLAAQGTVSVNGTAGVSFDVDDRAPVTGAGFAVLAGAGLRLHRLVLGGELGLYRLGGDRKARLIGAFLRLPAMAGRQVEPYLVLGLGQYRYSPATGSHNRAFGGSLGPGLAVALGGSRVRMLFESRFHGALDRIGTIGGQEFVSVAAGLELGM